MPQLSIDLTDDEHRHLQARASKAGSSLKDYVRYCVLDESLAIDDLSELAELLMPRIESADRGEVSSLSIKDVAKLARAKYAG